MRTAVDDLSSRASRPCLILVTAVTLLLGTWTPACRPPDEIFEPEVKLLEVHVRQYSGGEARVELELEIDNANAFEVSLVGADLELNLETTAMGRIAWSGQSVIAKSGTSRASLEAELAVGENAEIFSALIDRRPLRYALQGELSLARGVIARTMAVDAHGRLNAE